MTGRLRYVIAAAFVALLFLIPTPDSAEDRRYLGYLQVRKWLMDGDAFKAMTRTDEASGQKTVGPIRVDYRFDSGEGTSSPGRPLTGDARAAEVARFESSPREWAASQAADGEDIRFDPTLSPVPVQVTIGQQGSRITAGIGDTGISSGDMFFPTWESLIPPFVAIVLAILFGKVIPALLVGCLAGAWLTVRTGLGLAEGSGWWVASGGQQLFGDTLWQDVLGQGDLLGDDGFNLRVTGFVIFLFMTVGIMARCGGIQGMVQWVSRFARGPISSQICTWIIGILIFFDDYSNCIITGTTMRPLTDQNRVSREKLSYIVDSTAAPIAGISIFSTWVAYEVSQFRGQLPLVTNEAGQPYSANDGFAVFVQTLPFRFYCIFTIAMVLLTILLRRDWGPMLSAERRARHEGKPVADKARPMVSKGMAELEAPEGAPQRGLNALLPIVVLVGLTIGLIFYFGAYGDDGAWRVPEGMGTVETLQWIMGNSASEKALLYASGIALVVAATLAMGQRILTVGQTIGSALRSAHSLIFAVIILLLAWSIGQTCKDLGTNYYLTAAFRGVMTAEVLPVVLFLLSGLVAFSTGTSYGTMAILLPNVVVLSHTLGADSGFGGAALMVLSIGAVLEGSIFGDHCSPISDTTVLSSVGTGSDHLHHVQTQAPYAVLTMIVAVVAGYLPVLWIGPEAWPIAWGAGLGVMVLFLLVIGRNPGHRTS